VVADLPHLINSYLLPFIPYFQLLALLSNPKFRNPQSLAQTCFMKIVNVCSSSFSLPIVAYKLKPSRQGGPKSKDSAFRIPPSFHILLF
jgi:hypothetical protein